MGRSALAASLGTQGNLCLDYQFGAHARTCSASGKPLGPGDRCVSALVEQNGRLVRLDFLEAHWAEPPHTVGSWRFQIPEATAAQLRASETEALWRHFEQLTEDANPGLEKVRYVLALSLLQRRKLKLDGTRREGKIDLLIFLGTRGEGPYEVQDQQLSEEETNALNAELTRQMQPDGRNAA